MVNRFKATSDQALLIAWVLPMLIGIKLLVADPKCQLGHFLLKQIDQ
jgi:hypothetical protein